MVRMMGSSFIGDISDVASMVISMILDMLDTAIRQQNTVTALHVTMTISSLSCVKVTSAVVVMDPVLVGVGVGDFLVDGGVVVDRVNWREDGGKVIRKS